MKEKHMESGIYGMNSLSPFSFIKGLPWTTIS
jgi:hypothetical protein